MSEAIELLVQEMREIKEALKSSARDEGKLEQALDTAIDKADSAKPVVNPLAVPPSDEAEDLNDIILSKAADDKTLRLQELNDQLYTMKAMGMDWRTTKAGREFDKLKAAMAVANSGYGAEWAPTTYSNRVVEVMEQARQVSGLVDNIVLPRSPYAYPAMGASGLPYLVGEPTTDTAEKIPSAAEATAVTTFTAKTMAVRKPFSLDLDEDSLVAMQPMLERSVAMALVNGTETAIVNGDTTGAAAGTYSTATDPRLAWNGLRYHALATTACTNDSSTFAEAATLVTMGKITPGYGDNPEDMVWLTSSKVALKMLGSSAFPSFASIEKVGAAYAGNVKGFIGMYYGSPVVKSAYCYDTHDATGKEASSTYSVLLYFNKRAFALGTIRGITISTLFNPETLQWSVIGHQRQAFMPWIAQTTTANRAVAMGVKIS